MSGLNLSAIIFNAGGVGVGALGLALLIVRLCTTEGPRRQHVRALMAMLAILTLDCGFSIYEQAPVVDRFPSLIGGGYLFLAWLPTALWLYVDGLTTAIPRDRPRMPWHAAASSLSTLCLLPLMFLSGADKHALMQDRFVPSTAPQAIMLLGLAAFFIIWMAHLIVSGIAVARRLLRHRRRIRELCSDVTAQDLRWLDGLLLLIVTGIGLGAAQNLLPLATGREPLDSTGGAVLEAVIVFALALFGLNQGPAVPAWADDAVTPAPVAGPASDKAGGRYARSSLSDADCRDIIEKLDRVMHRDAPWRDPFLNLKILSERVATRPYYVTQALNTALGRNFYDYVNGWRVRAACAELTSGDASILAICEAVGFNSKSTFNTVFRKETGVTPSAYRRASPARPDGD
jgi:AraC-like DNA-binding protein